MKILLVNLIILLLLAVPIAAQLPEGEPPAPEFGEEHLVTIKDFEFEGGTLDIKVGDTVFWTNAGSSPHTVTQDSSAGFDLGTLDPGEEITVRIAEGTHDLEFQSISGSGGCFVSKLVLVECDTEFRNCSF